MPASAPALGAGLRGTPLVDPIRVALLLLGLLAALALAPELLAPNSPDEVVLARALSEPSPALPLGADQFGRCELSRLIFGARYSLGAGLVVLATVAALAGALAGLAAAGLRFWSGLAERLIETGLALPTLLYAVAVVGLLGPGLANGMLAVAVGAWPWPARVVLHLLRTESSAPHVEAARALGVGRARLLLRHLAPGVAGRAAVLISLLLGQILLTLAALAYLGLGPQPPTPEWGAMIGEARGLFYEAPWLSLLPGLLILATVGACNLLAEALAERLDERPGRWRTGRGGSRPS